MIPEEKIVFQNIIDILVTNYKIPVEIWDDMVHYQGYVVFNTAGYNLLYCITKLSETLKDELL